MSFLHGLRARVRALANRSGAHGGRRRPWIDDLGGDVRFALRVLRRSPVLSAAAVLTIALGIGANTAIFSAVNAVVLRPLPFPHPERLVMISEESAERHWHRQWASTPNFLDWRESATAFADMAAYVYGQGSSTLSGNGDARKVHSLDVTGTFFSTLGVRAELGRLFDEADTWDRAPRAAVLSHAAWMREFGGDRDIVGRSITLDGDAYRVVGVAPPAFEFPYEGLDVWTAVHWGPEARTSDMWRNTRWMLVIGRLQPGVTMAAANAQLGQIAARLAHDHPTTNAGATTSIAPLHDFLVGDTRLPLLILLASVAILLLIACANVGNLMLVQAAGRQREVALRLALGAGRARILRQSITESLVLSLIGGVCGLGGGWAGTHALSALQPPGLLRVASFGIDRPVALYAALIALVSGLLFGVAPALWTRHRDPGEALKGGSRGTQSKGITRWGGALVIGEVALAVLMTTAAGLLLRSFWHVTHVDPGYDASGVVALSVYAQPVVADERAFFDQLTGRVRSLPGVTAIATGSVPLALENAHRTPFVARGRAPSVPGTDVLHFYVSPEYFATLRIPLLRGRLFTSADREGSPPVVVINEALARTYFAGTDPIGQSLNFARPGGGAAPWYTVIGVVGDVHDAGLDKAPRITVFETTRQAGVRGNLLIRTAGDPTSLVGPLRAIVRDLEPRLAPSIGGADDVRNRQLARPRFFATLLGLFAGVGLALSVVGVYALLAQLARNRTREMGIRIALGARAAEVRWLVVRHGLRLTCAGLAAGVVGALLTTRVMTTLLFRVAPTDPLTFAGVVVLLAATSLVASWIPAVRASRANPVEALRAD